MDATQWQEVERIFFEIVDLSPTEQGKYLDALKLEHPQMAQEVLLLLKEEQALHPMLQTDATPGWQGWEDLELIGKNIGKYRLESLLGSGGMGTVFLADRADGNFEQQVALKLMRSGIYNAQSLKGFLQERQILARLQHPHIARLLDGGVYAGDRPFYTLEYIEGETLDDYCDQLSLDLEGRLKLFVQVCEAVQYAHSQLTLHLDIKPNNILVDKRGTVKLLDFGIAQLLNQPTERVEEPINWERRYTLAYASPEQLNAESLSTASDTYSLGIVLHKILSGAHPFQESMGDKEEFRVRILTQAPPLLKESLGQDMPYSFRQLTGDLEAICQKALKKDPKDRYPSVLSLQKDIQSFLDRRPISLNSNNPQDTFRKFVLRNQSLVATTLIGILLLVSVVGFYTWELQKKEEYAREEAEKATQVASLLTELFSQSNPNVSLGKEMTARELLDKGTSKVQQMLKNDPPMLAKMYEVLGRIYMDRAEYPQADSLLSRAKMLHDTSSSLSHSDKVLTYLHLGALKYRNSQYDTARSLFYEALRMNEQLPKAQTSYERDILLELAQMDGELGNYKRSDSLLNELLAEANEGTALPDSELSNIFLAQGINARKLGEYDRAKEHYQASLTLRKQIYPEVHPEIAYCLNHLASLYYDQRKYKEAIPFAEASYEMRREVFGEKHPETLASLSNLSRNLGRTGAYEEARSHYQKAYELMEEIYGYPNQYLGAIKGSIAGTYLRAGEFKKALPLYKDALDIALETLPPDHIRLNQVYANYATGLYKNQLYSEAEEAFFESIRIQKAHLPDTHPNIALIQKKLGECLIQQGKVEEGKQQLLHSLAVLKKEPSVYAMEVAEIEEMLKGLNG
ncbi:MAG: serine/threonine-protein kinase [Bacteroidota bacterium]